MCHPEPAHRVILSLSKDARVILSLSKDGLNANVRRSGHIAAHCVAA